MQVCKRVTHFLASYLYTLVDVNYVEPAVEHSTAIDSVDAAEPVAEPLKPAAEPVEPVEPVEPMEPKKYNLRKRVNI